MTAKQNIHVEGQNDEGRLAKVVADKDFYKDEEIRKLNYKLNDKTYKTVQLGLDKHGLLLDELVYLNHSCSPNVYFKNETLCALSEIKQGDELTFFYPSTEWEMKEPFECWCKSKDCIRSVQGAKYLNKDTLKKFYLSTHIRELAQI
eukprot:NODE_185_length_13590_cov_0.472908.p12 type:complete len:147 gc:universal NODE_185_length_13590_cov_0.472908:4288-3848(-)